MRRCRAGGPEGCFFEPRCSLATDECRRAFPPATEFGAGHLVRCYHAAEAPREVPVEGATSVHVASEPELALAIRGLDAHHGARATLFGIELEVHRHECLALVGESGSGKTTLARCVAGLHKDYTGAVMLGDDELPPAARSRSDAARKQIQYVFQNPYASLNPRRTVGQTVARQLELFFPGRKDMAQRVAECLERVSLSASAAAAYPDELSGGERQRVAIARALAAEPAVMVCDEITSALDVSVQAAIIDLLRELRTSMGLSLLFITHNLALIRTIADRVAVMTEGRIVELGPTAQVLERPIAPYTQQLLANTPSIAPVEGPATVG